MATSTATAEVTITVSPSATRDLFGSRESSYGRWLTQRMNYGANIAKKLVPVRTGYLRSRIDSEVVESPEGLIGYLRARTPYAAFVNDGTRYMHARPFMTEAMRQMFH